MKKIGSFVEFECAVINERTRNRRITRLNENNWGGGKSAFGYKVNIQRLRPMKIGYINI